MKKLVVWVALLALAAGAQAQLFQPIGAATRALVVSNAEAKFAVFSSAEYGGYPGMKRCVLLSVQENPVYVNFDSTTNPLTSVNGHLLSNGTLAVWSAQAATAARWVGAGAVTSRVVATELVE